MSEQPNDIPADVLLAAFDVQESPLRRGGVNASMTQIQDGSKAAVKLRVFSNLQGKLRNGQTGHDIDLDALDANLLADKVNEKARSIPEFAEQDASTVAERCVFLRQLCSGRPSRALRMLSELSERIVDEELSVIRQQFSKTVGGHPFGASQLAERAGEAIALVATPDIDHTATRRLANAVRAQRQLQDNPAMLPPAQRDAIGAVLQRQAELLADESMMSVCLEQVTNCLRRALKSLHRQVQDCKTFGGEFVQNMSAVRTCLEDQRRQLKHQDAATEDGVEIVLSGPDESTLIAAMLSQEGLRDLDELTTRQLEMLQVRLSEIAKAKYPALGDQAPIGELLTRIGPVDIAAAISDMVDQSIGTRHTVFSAIGAIGITEFVNRLLNKANVLVHLGGYRHERLHIQPIDQVLVRFPKRVGDDDEQVYKALREALSNAAPGCQFADAGPGERDIKCVKTLVGFPIGVEQMNECLLDNYAHCDPHPPHLYGLVTENGEPLAEARWLFETRSK